MNVRIQGEIDNVNVNIERFVTHNLNGIRIEGEKFKLLLLDPVQARRLAFLLIGIVDGLEDAKKSDTDANKS